MFKSLKKAVKDFNYGLSREMFGDHKPVMPTYGKRDNYDDLKIMNGAKSIVKGKIVR
jgi:hypothetical protein